MTHTPEEIGAKMDALGLWKVLETCNFAIKPRGTAFPYFCTALRGEQNQVKERFLLLEGWQTLHDFVRTRVDRNFGYYQTPMEMPHFELIVLESGATHLFRHDPGYMPLEAKGSARELASRILWEAYGVMLRLEGEPGLAMRFAAEKAVFARIESSDATWSDAPLVIPAPPVQVERVTLSQSDVKAAKDLPFANGDVLELDFHLLVNVMTKEPRPRCVYELLGVDPKTKERVIASRVSVHPEGGLKGMWEAVPAQLLREFARCGKVPGEVRVCSGRLFRLLRPVCMELPFKLSLHDKLSI